VNPPGPPPSGIELQFVGRPVRNLVTSDWDVTSGSCLRKIAAQFRRIWRIVIKLFIGSLAEFSGADTSKYRVVNLEGCSAVEQY
jgi:hypothetical protein